MEFYKVVLGSHEPRDERDNTGLEHVLLGEDSQVFVEFFSLKGVDWGIWLGKVEPGVRD